MKYDGMDDEDRDRVKSRRKGTKRVLDSVRIDYPIPDLGHKQEQAPLLRIKHIIDLSWSPTSCDNQQKHARKAIMRKCEDMWMTDQCLQPTRNTEPLQLTCYFFCLWNDEIRRALHVCRSLALGGKQGKKQREKLQTTRK